MISLEHLSVRYPNATTPVLRDVDLVIPEGELCLVVGGTGSGKSTLLGAICGLVPHFTGGYVSGRVVVDGRDTRLHPPRELADLVGVVSQDPLAGFVTETVEEELAYVMEQLAIAPAVMRKRVEETLDLLGIAELRRRRLQTLSGGQQQRVAIGSVLTAHPKVLVLDEPTSALDPTAAEEVIATISRLVHDLGTTVVLAEHRLERVIHHADRVVVLAGDGSVISGPPAEIMEHSPVAPPVVQLGRLAGWHPLPLSVRDARRRSGELRERLAATRASSSTVVNTSTSPGAQGPALHSNKVVVQYPGVVAVREVSLDLYRGQVMALMGRNGSGKSSLLWAWQGTGPMASGTVTINGDQTREQDASAARRSIGLVPQTPSDLLYLTTVAAECAQADTESERPAGSTRALLDRIVGGGAVERIPDDRHPRDLSEGQRLALALAVQLVVEPKILLLDEPTRGLDYSTKERLVKVLRKLASEGRAIVCATHDVEFVALVADQVVVMAEGEVVADGRTAEVVVASPAFAPQVAKILQPEEFLTVEQVAAALGADLETLG